MDGTLDEIFQNFRKSSKLKSFENSLNKDKSVRLQKISDTKKWHKICSHCRIGASISY